MGKGNDPQLTCSTSAMLVEDADPLLVDEGPRAMTRAKSPDKPNDDDFLLSPADGAAAVLDGMGGHHAGYEAAGLCARRLRGLLADLPAEGDRDGHSQEMLEMLRGELTAARVTRRDLGNSDTTAVIVLRDGPFLDVAWAGDSRAYALGGDGRCDLLTEDHDLFSRALRPEDRALVREALDEADGKEDAGERFGEIARNAFRQRASVTASVGQGDIGHARVPADGVRAVLLCSDGVHDNLTASQIRQICAEHADDRDGLAAALIGAARQKIERATGRAKPDDITVVVLEVA